MKKWKYELIVVVALIVVGLGVWWFVATEDERAAKVELETLIKYAQRQALEIAIIEQTSKLQNYKQQLIAMQQAKPVPLPVPQPTPQMPVIADPKDVNVD